MKDNKLFAAMSHLDEKLVEEALQIPQKKRHTVLKVTATAAAFALIAVSAALLVSVSQHPDVIAEPKVSPAPTSENAEKTSSVVSEQPHQTASSEQNSQTVSTGTPTIPHTSKTPPANTPDPQTSVATPVQLPVTEDESSDQLGFIIRDGQTYMQVFTDTQYTLNEVIGAADDFPGSYRDLHDDSKIYTVKEDNKILVVKLANGGSVNLMLWEDVGVDHMGYYLFHGLRVDRSLMAALSSNDGKTYSVSVTRPDSDDMYDYEYNGRTLREIRDALHESWKTEHGKYNPLEEEYQTALDAFLQEKVAYIYNILVANGIQAEVFNGVRCEAKMTKEQFEALAATNSYLDEYAFGLLSMGYFTEDPDA